MTKNKSYLILMLIFIINFSLISSAQNNNQDVFDPSKTVSVDFRDTEISDVFRSISELCGVNIVSEKNVRGKVTITLKDVSLNDAMNAILSINNFRWKKQGEIILVQAQKKLTTKFVQLNYADGAELIEIIDDLKSDKGKILVDTRSNKLVIREYEENLKEMELIIDELDIPTKQVMINAKIIDIKVTDAIRLGLNIGFTNKKGDPEGDKVETSEGFEMYESEDEESRAYGRNSSSTTSKARSKDYSVDLRAPGDANFGYDYSDYQSSQKTISDISRVGTLTTSVLSAALTDVINVELDALITKDNALLLASPSITTLNNETASIIIGEKVGIKEQTQTTTGTTETIRFQDVGTKLEVTPQINVDGYITMTITPEISSVTEYTQDVYRFETREAKTKVRIKDGQTVIIGGLIKNQESIGRKRVPFISKIPLLGIPFRSKYDSGEKKELVVFITPYIISDHKSQTPFSNFENTSNMQAKAKEEELIKQFKYGYTFNKENVNNMTGEISTAKILYKEALKLSRKAKRISDEERKGKINKIAYQKLTKLEEMYPESKYLAEAIFLMAVIEERNGNYDLASMKLNRIIDNYPHKNIYKKAVKKLKKLNT